MEIILPDGPGWSALHLVSADWGSSAVIVKREWRITGQTTVSYAPGAGEALEGVIMADTVTMRDVAGTEVQIIAREAETALFKSYTDILFLGRGTEARDPDGQDVSSAFLRVGGVTRRTYARPAAQHRDPVNLFGYEPRANRITGDIVPGAFDYAGTAPSLFRSARRSNGYAIPNPAFALSGALEIAVSTRNAAMTTDDPDHPVAEVSVQVPDVTAQAFVWEGGANAPANWCRRAPRAMVADTLTVGLDRVSVLWRVALPLAEMPAADLRRIDVKEAA